MILNNKWFKLILNQLIKISLLKNNKIWSLKINIKNRMEIVLKVQKMVIQKMVWKVEKMETLKNKVKKTEKIKNNKKNNGKKMVKKVEKIVWKIPSIKMEKIVWKIPSIKNNIKNRKETVKKAHKMEKEKKKYRIQMDI